jgi:hypothetical protein
VGGAEKVAVAEGEPVEDAEGEGKEDDVALVVALSVHTGPVNIPYTSTVEPTSRRRRNTPGPPGSRSAGAKLQEWAMGGGSRDPTAPPHEKNAMIAVIIIIGKASPRKKQDKAASLLRILGSGPRRRRLSGRLSGRPAGGTHGSSHGGLNSSLDTSGAPLKFCGSVGWLLQLRISRSLFLSQPLLRAWRGAPAAGPRAGGSGRP